MLIALAYSVSSATIAPVIWFSDSSRRRGIDDFATDSFEGQRTGRLLSYDPRWSGPRAPYLAEQL